LQRSSRRKKLESGDGRLNNLKIIVKQPDASGRVERGLPKLKAQLLSKALPMLSKLFQGSAIFEAEIPFGDQSSRF
jgi:hypothetical protein